MNRLLFLFICIACIVSAKAQNNYAEAIKQGDAAFKKGQYKLAIDKYFAAEAFDPTKKEMVTEKVKITFDRIEALRQEAFNSNRKADSARKIALNALEEAKNQKKEAENQKREAERQETLAREAEKEAENLRGIAEQNLEAFRKLKETEIGSFYQGGIVISSWEDTTGKHIIIAAEKDLGKFTWKEAKAVCKNLVLNEYDDWHLPSRTELGVLYANSNVVGGFEKSYYWTCTEAGIFQIKAWSQIFTTGFQTGRGKNNKYLVRPVRVSSSGKGTVTFGCPPSR